MDLTKHDLTLAYKGRTFAVRAYRAGGGPGAPGWHSVIVENRTPLLHDQEPSASLAGCFAEAVRCLVAAVEAQAAATRPG